MGLSKRVTHEDGVTTNYHRIRSLNHDVNLITQVEVVSYTARAKRTEEADLEAQGLATTAYRHIQWVDVPYGEVWTVEEAYEWLKGTPTFEGATDVLDE